MASVNYTNFNQDLTVRVFDRFYEFELEVPVNEYDAVLTYFKSVMEDNTIAGNFTVSLFRVAQDTKIPVMTLLQSFQDSSGMELNVNMAYYMNTIRSRATLLGVNVSATPNYYAARSVIQ